MIINHGTIVLTKTDIVFMSGHEVWGHHEGLPNALSELIELAIKRLERLKAGDVSGACITNCVFIGKPPWKDKLKHIWKVLWL